ncbi:MAG: hypothetical protein AAF558_06355 [Verrucomicrobiota bacterium]
MRNIPMLMAVFFLLVGGGDSRAMNSDELEALLKSVNLKDQENISLQYDEVRGELKLGRKIAINPLRYMIETQVVRVKYLIPKGQIDKIGSRIQPWIKVRCKEGRQAVEVRTQVFVEETEVEMDGTEETRALMVFPCDPYEVEKLAEGFTQFLSRISG